jgi:TLC domain
MAFNIRILWNCLSVFLVSVSLYFITCIFRFRTEAQKLGVEFNEFSDLYTALGCLLVIIAFRYVGTLTLQSYLQVRLKAVESDLDMYELKKNKVTKEFLSFLWYTFITLYGNLALRGHPYIPSILGGGGTCEGIALDYARKRGDPLINFYYMIQSAHHMYSLLDHMFVTKKGKDFAEMALHHICAITAILFSYFTNQVAFGAVVLLIHDYGDVFLNLGKFVRDFKFAPNWMLNVIFMLLLLTWMVPRCFMICFCVLPAGIYTRHFNPQLNDDRFTSLQDMMFYVDLLQIFFVIVIMLLNAWWSWFILRTAYLRYFAANKITGFVIHTQGEKVEPGHRTSN